MSGGALDYFFGRLQDHVGDFKDKELDDLTKDLSELFYAREWFMSGDTCEGEWCEARDKFKKKWFGKGSRAKRIEKYLDEIKVDVMAQFCEDRRKCMNCKHWTRESEKYGACEYETCHLWHRSEVCDKWEEKSE